MHRLETELKSEILSAAELRARLANEPLTLEELRELLGKAGYSLTHASEFDIIVEYFVTQGIYNVFTINEALFAFAQSLLGA